jgi:hypothetical protein
LDVYQAAAPKPKAEKKKEKVKPAQDEPLADPLAEKLRQQRYLSTSSQEST